MRGGIHTSMQIDGLRYNWCNCNTLQDINARARVDNLINDIQ